MVSKASLETLARTMSVAALAATTAFTLHGVAEKNPATATTTDAAVYLGVDTTTTARVAAAKRSTRSFRVFTAASCPKSVEMRGLWLKALLREAGFRGEHLKEAWAIAMRESTGRATAHNGNRKTGDNSYGIFQINMIDGLGADRRAKFDLSSNAELLNPMTNARIALYMSNHGKNWSSWEPYNGGSKERGYRKWLSKYPEA